MKKIRILMVLGNTGRGGSQSYTMNILRHINKEIFEVDFAVYEDKVNGYGDEIRKFGCYINIVPQFNGLNYLSCLKVWKKLYQEGKYDIVHGHATNAAFIYLRLAKQMGIKTIIHSHSAGYRGNQFERHIKPIFSYFGQLYADYWFACSEKAAQKLYGNRHHVYSHYYCLPNAIEVSKYKFNPIVREKIRNELNIKKDTKIIGHVGSFSAPKNHKFLIKIFNKFKQENPNSKLLLCGDGPLQQIIKDNISMLGLTSDVIMTGNIPNVEDYMMAMDIMVFPSLFEGLPVSVVEAQATGLPVILSDTITNEVSISNLVIKCSINDEIDKWCSVIKHTYSDNRVHYNQIIRKSKFSMEDSIKEIQRLYLELTSVGK